MKRLAMTVVNRNTELTSIQREMLDDSYTLWFIYVEPENGWTVEVVEKATHDLNRWIDLGYDVVFIDPVGPLVSNVAFHQGEKVSSGGSGSVFVWHEVAGQHYLL